MGGMSRGPRSISPSRQGEPPAGRQNMREREGGGRPGPVLCRPVSRQASGLHVIDAGHGDDDLGLIGEVDQPPAPEVSERELEVVDRAAEELGEHQE